MKFDLVLVNPPNDTSPNPKLGGARVAIFEDADSSIVSEDGLSLIPLHAVFMDEETEAKNLPSIPDGAPKVELSMATFENFFDHLPKDDTEKDETANAIAKRFWEIEIKDDFPKDQLGRLVFKLHSQFIFNKKTVFYPYLKKRVLEHVNDMVFKRKASVELSRPLENAEQALNLAFWLVAITVVTDGMTCVLIHDQEKGPLVMPKGVTKAKWVGFHETHKVITRDPRKKLLEDMTRAMANTGHCCSKGIDENVLQGMGGRESKDLESSAGHNCGTEDRPECQCGPTTGCQCGSKED